MPIILYMTLPEDQKIRIEDLFQKFGESLYQFIRHRIKDAHLAEEILHDVFVLLIEQPERMANRSDAELRSFLYTAAKHRVYRVHKERTREPLLTDTELFEEGSVKFEELLVRQAIGSIRIGEYIDDIVEQLSPESQDVLYLKYAKDCTNAEVAEILGESYDAVSKRISRAYAEIRRIIESEKEGTEHGR